MHTIEKGDLAVAMLTARFLQRRWTVLRPVSELSRYDLVIDRGEGFERVQCKTGRLREGAVRFNVCSSLAHHGKNKPARPYLGQVELFGVYCPENDSCYLVPVEQVGTSEGSLRVDPSKNNQVAGVRWASDHAL